MLRQAKTQVPLVQVNPSNVPYGWTNDPAYLRAQIYFTDGPDNIMTTLKDEYKIPNAQPILNDRSCLYLINGGDEKYYLWNDTSGDVARIHQSDLPKILKTIGEHGVAGLEYTVLKKWQTYLIELGDVILDLYRLEE